jgi:hypothetical protein
LEFGKQIKWRDRAQSPTKRKRGKKSLGWI